MEQKTRHKKGIQTFYTTSNRRLKSAFEYQFRYVKKAKIPRIAFCT